MIKFNLSSQLINLMYHLYNKLRNKINGIYLDSKRISNTSQELNMSTIQLTSSFPNPNHVGRTIIVKPRCRVLSSQRLLIRQVEALMGSPKFSCGHDWVINGEPSRRHKP